MDVSLWVPGDLLEASDLSEHQKLELLADIHSMLERIDPGALPPEQRERFNRRRYSLGEKLELPELTSAAFSALEAEGSTAGYYLRARSIGPTLDRTESDEVDTEDKSKAANAVAFLRTNWHKIERDDRCLRYLLQCEWMVDVGQRLLRGERGALPSGETERRELLRVVKAIKSTDANVDHNLSYLEAVLSWLNNEEQHAAQIWRELSRETDFVDARRVIRRNIVTDEHHNPITFSGRVESVSDGGSFTLRIDKLNRRISVLSRDFPDIELAYGRSIPSFAVAFNYIGPIADPVRRSASHA
jgi:hypothetical protein